MPHVHRQVILRATPDAVWSALTRPGELSSWFGARVELDPVPGGRLTARWPDGWERGALVERVEPGRRLVLRWLPFERGPAGLARPAPTGWVELAIQQAPEGTLLSVSEWRGLVGEGSTATGDPGAPVPAGVLP